MTTLHDLLEAHVGAGTVPGAVGVVARGDRVEIAAVGSQDVGGSVPMARDSIFRVASITKSVTAAALLILVEEGRTQVTE
ncbi:serine hydrolase [Streptomyces sp. NPDC002250]|uniref:serine hydrolase n=1 Tax=Streptomyces sp. NPDC002250 TaxID=3364641 RepID=UPI00369BF370